MVTKRLLSVAMFLFMIQACTPESKVETHKLEIEAVNFLIDEVLLNPSEHKPFQKDPFLIDVFAVSDFDNQKFYILDSICSWSNLTSDTDRPLLKPFSCYPLENKELYDLEKISLEEFVSLQDTSSYLIEIKRSILDDRRAYVTLNLYSKQPDKQAQCYNMILKEGHLKLESVCMTDAFDYSFRGL
ncbi:hypothetical protein LVD15_23175 [Fulvivirga maritima]|uniref:hypothetical protein n=1 Tax=Fulvivirga maritima TaxID=2904247 RepID=UPI001F3FC5FA|nr:hypothetical protein [Fulvivirga maritima]UII26172.1 hypothetical protein LVD15_23175 [Fulvivirga maritima]